jgi:hypothetical protein
MEKEKASKSTKEVDENLKDSDADDEKCKDLKEEDCNKNSACTLAASKASISEHCVSNFGVLGGAWDSAKGSRAGMVWGTAQSLADAVGQAAEQTASGLLAVANPGAGKDLDFPHYSANSTNID